MALKEDIEKIVESYGAKVYDIEMVEENGHKIFRIYVVKDKSDKNQSDSESGVNIELCTNISRDISPLLDIEPPINGEYNFEVSSPGVERKLTKPSHFKNSIGERVKIKVLGDKKYKGKLISANDNEVEIETKDGNFKFQYNQLGTSKTYFEW